MRKCLIMYIFSLCCDTFAMGFSVLIDNTTNEAFEIKTKEILHEGDSPRDTLLPSTMVSDIWYGGSKIGENITIPGNTKKRLFVTVDSQAHKGRSDYMRLENHIGYFCIHFGSVSGNLKCPLPVITDDVSMNVPAKHAKIFGDECTAKSGYYRTKHISSKAEGAEVVTISSIE